MPVWGIAASLVLLLVIAGGTTTVLVTAHANEPTAAERAEAEARSRELLDEYARREAEREAKAEHNSKFHITIPADRPLSIFFAGDSLGAGFHATTREQGYRWLVEDYFEQYGAVSSTAATKDASEPLFQAGNAKGIPASGIDVAVIELGTNDAGRTELPEFRDQYRALIDGIRVGSPDAAVVCVGIWGQEGVTRGIDFVIDQVCREAGGKYVDVTRHYATPESFGPEGRDTWIGPADNFHPNDLGHRLIADEILTVLTVD